MCTNGFSPRKTQNVPVNTHAALFHIHLKPEAMLITNHSYKLRHVHAMNIYLGCLKRLSSQMSKDEQSSPDTRMCIASYTVDMKAQQGCGFCSKHSMWASSLGSEKSVNLDCHGHTGAHLPNLIQLTMSRFYCDKHWNSMEQCVTLRFLFRVSQLALARQCGRCSTVQEDFFSWVPAHRHIPPDLPSGRTVCMSTGAEPEWSQVWCGHTVWPFSSLMENFRSWAALEMFTDQHPGMLQIVNQRRVWLLLKKAGTLDSRHPDRLRSPLWSFSREGPMV